jgi:outer membrane biogenesis lipoprotein LolB
MKIIMFFLFVLVILILPGLAATAQKKPLDCYTTYKNKGDSFNRARKDNLAIEQYQIAKKCRYLNNDQIKTLDNLIASIKRRQPLIRRY